MDKYQYDPTNIPITPYVITPPNPTTIPSTTATHFQLNVPQQPQCRQYHLPPIPTAESTFIPTLLALIQSISQHYSKKPLIYTLSTGLRSQTPGPKVLNLLHATQCPPVPRPGSRFTNKRNQSISISKRRKSPLAIHRPAPHNTLDATRPFPTHTLALENYLRELLTKFRNSSRKPSAKTNLIQKPSESLTQPKSGWFSTWFGGGANVKGGEKESQSKQAPSSPSPITPHYFPKNPPLNEAAAMVDYPYTKALCFEVTIRDNCADGEKHLLAQWYVNFMLFSDFDFFMYLLPQCLFAFLDRESILRQYDNHVQKRYQARLNRNRTANGANSNTTNTKSSSKMFNLAEVSTNRALHKIHAEISKAGLQYLSQAILHIQYCLYTSPQLPPRGKGSNNRTSIISPLTTSTHNAIVGNTYTTRPAREAPIILDHSNNSQQNKPNLRHTISHPQFQPPSVLHQPPLIPLITHEANYFSQRDRRLLFSPSPIHHMGHHSGAKTRDLEFHPSHFPHFSLDPLGTRTAHVYPNPTPSRYLSGFPHKPAQPPVGHVSAGVDAIAAYNPYQRPYSYEKMMELDSLDRKIQASMLQQQHISHHFHQFPTLPTTSQKPRKMRKVINPHQPLLHTYEPCEDENEDDDDDPLLLYQKRQNIRENDEKEKIKNFAKIELTLLSFAEILAQQQSEQQKQQTNNLVTNLLKRNVTYHNTMVTLVKDSILNIQQQLQCRQQHHHSYSKITTKQHWPTLNFTPVSGQKSHKLQSLPNTPPDSMVYSVTLTDPSINTVYIMERDHLDGPRAIRRYYEYKTQQLCHVYPYLLQSDYVVSQPQSLVTPAAPQKTHGKANAPPPPSSALSSTPTPPPSVPLLLKTRFLYYFSCHCLSCQQHLIRQAMLPTIDTMNNPQFFTKVPQDLDNNADVLEYERNAQAQLMGRETALKQHLSLDEMVQRRVSANIAKYPHIMLLNTTATQRLQELPPIHSDEDSEECYTPGEESDDDALYAEFLDRYEVPEALQQFPHDYGVYTHNALVHASASVMNKTRMTNLEKADKSPLAKQASTDTTKTPTAPPKPLPPKPSTLPQKKPSTSDALAGVWSIAMGKGGK